MHKKPLGKTGLQLSEIGLGCGSFGGIGSDPATRGKGASEAEAFAIMDTAFELGINWFDTADAYAGGESERMIGRWLRSKGPSVRQGLLLGTKVGNRVGEGTQERGLSRLHILRQIDASLARLGVEHVDMYLIHQPDPETPIEETMAALDEVVRSGKARALGACNVDSALLSQFLAISERLGASRFAWVQNSFSLLDRGDQKNLFPLLQQHDLGYTPFSPLAGGWLTGKYRAGEASPPGTRADVMPGPYDRYRSETTFRSIDRLRQWGAQRGWDVGAAALRWVVDHPGVTAPLIGPKSVAHLETARQALSIRLTPEEHAEVAAFFD